MPGFCQRNLLPAGNIQPPYYDLVLTEAALTAKYIGIVLMCILTVGKEADCEMKQLEEREDK